MTDSSETPEWRHVKNPFAGTNHCLWDSQPWPCDAEKMRLARDQALDDLRLALEANGRLRDDFENRIYVELRAVTEGGGNRRWYRPDPNSTDLIEVVPLSLVIEAIAAARIALAPGGKE